MSIEVSCFEIYVIESFSFTIHHRYRVLLLEYLPWRVVVWSFAFSMSAVKSGCLVGLAFRLTAIESYRLEFCF